MENANGLLRQHFPKAMRLDGVRADALGRAVSELNRRPRKRLCWETPEDRFRTDAALASRSQSRHN